MKRFDYLRYILFFIFVFPAGFSFSQTESSLTDLRILFDKLLYAYDDEVKDSLNSVIIKKTGNFAVNNDDIEVLKGIGNMSVSVSEDKKFFVITWAIRYSDNNYKYFGYVKYYENDFGRYSVDFLNDKSDEIVNPEMQVLGTDNWYGALYYKLITKKYKKKRYYYLLGWDGNNDLTTRKLIDVFYLNENKDPVFGKAVFESESGIKYRCIFEYREGIAMSLRYDKKKDLIIWDHLSPSKPSLKGHFEYYGPDLTYDALYYDKGIWKYIADYDITEK